ncbi:DUF6185 family protein [Streptomyces sp. NPDC037389]|uniref:DUF6185 family protein n=1 Tax=Streptomyces sp. NPDC037389 TaxID=3155369 RepID=UPI0033D52FA6
MVLLAGLVCWAAGWPAWAHAAEAPRADDCHTAQLADAHTQVDLRLANHAHSVPEAKGLMTVQVPASWPYADDLLLSEDSADYRRAMRCLLRDPRSMKRPEEWRPHSPQVKAGASRVEVRYETLFFFNSGGPFHVGPWGVGVHSKKWDLELIAPPALKGAHWDRVQIDPGGLGASKVAPMPSGESNGRMVWTGLGASAGPRPMVSVQMVPPWQRGWAASDTTATLLVANAVGVTTWWLGTSVVIVLAALRARRQPAGPELTGLERNSGTTLWQWGVLKAVLGVMVLLLYKVILAVVDVPALKRPDWIGDSVLIGLLAGWLFVVTARPRRSFVVASSVVASAAGLVAMAPSLFGLPTQLADVEGRTDSAGFAVLVALAAAVQWLWLAGFVLWGWTLVHKGGLLRPEAVPWRLRRLGPVLVVVVALFVMWAVWFDEHKWQRTTWLMDRGAGGYHSVHVAALVYDAVHYAAQVPLWYYAHVWVLTGLAIVALLRARDLAPAVPYASPGPLDRLLLAVFFAVVVVWRQGSYAGVQAFTPLWFVLGIAALYGLLAVGGRRSVLAQHFEGCGDGSPQLCETITEAERSRLIARARRFRELTVALRAGDQGGADAALRRHALEKELSGLHRWRPNHDIGGGAARPLLPSHITVVDVALSWGPHAKWWDNARHAAVLAAGYGLPGSALLVWLFYGPEEQWMRWGMYFFGAPDLLWRFVYWELVWAGAGLVLGALWRLLPGRRGPARALSLTLAYTLLIGLGVLGSLIADQDFGNVAVAVSLMLLVLTLTSLAMDADTFRSERRFWPNRVGLLLSIYQIRGFSAQVAYVLMQLVAVLTILRFFAQGEGTFK